MVLYILLTPSRDHINVSLALSCICARCNCICVTLNRQSVDAIKSKIIDESHVLLCSETIIYRITFDILKIMEDVRASLCVFVTIGKPHALILSSPCVCLFCVFSHFYAFIALLYCAFTKRMCATDIARNQLDFDNRMDGIVNWCYTGITLTSSSGGNDRRERERRNVLLTDNAEHEARDV